MVRKLFLDEKFILGLILINSVVLFIGGYLATDHEIFILSIVDHLITSLFIIELIIKIDAFGIKGFFSSNWNKLDFLLIIISLPALVIFLFNLNMIDFSFLLVFRILRVFKTFRFFKFIPDVGKLVSGIQRALKASLFIIIGFIIYIFIIGILSFNLFQENDTIYFNNPMISLYSIFKIFTIEGWFEIPEQLTIHYSKSGTFFTYLYFIFIVLTGGILGLSIVNSIFVDSMVSDNNDDLEKKIDNLNERISELITNINNNEIRKNT
jgi:voltage-gated sodium channel